MFSMTSRNIPFLEMRFERLPYLDTSQCKTYSFPLITEFLTVWKNKKEEIFYLSM